MMSYTEILPTFIALILSLWRDINAALNFHQQLCMLDEGDI